MSERLRPCRSPRDSRDDLGDRWRCGGRGKAEPRRRQHRAQLSEVRAVEGSRQAGDRMVVGRSVPLLTTTAGATAGAYAAQGDASHGVGHGAPRWALRNARRHQMQKPSQDRPVPERHVEKEGCRPDAPAAIGCLINADVFDTHAVEGVGRLNERRDLRVGGQEDTLSLSSFDHRVRESPQRRGSPAADDYPNTAAAADPNDLTAEPAPDHPNSLTAENCRSKTATPSCVTPPPSGLGRPPVFTRDGTRSGRPACCR